MTNVPWASPEALGRLTLPQLYCLGSPAPPDGRPAAATFEEYEAALARRAALDGAWDC